MKQLGALTYHPKWVTHMGCVKSCLDYLGIDVSDAWLFGATGHAFVVNIHEAVCPSGPTAWKTEVLSVLGRNVGYVSDRVFSHRSAHDFADRQADAWDLVKAAIDAECPCYGWELAVPEYYLVYGYDDVGYRFRDLDGTGRGPKPWRELGQSEIGVLEMYRLKPGAPVDDVTAVKDALEFALEIAESPPKWIHPGYQAGVAGFNRWIRALEAGKVDGFGNAYNAAVWHECRRHAAAFLCEAQRRIGGGVTALFDEAIRQYRRVAECLARFTKLFPFTGPSTTGNEVTDRDHVMRGLTHLRTARAAEESGLRTLARIARSV
jgi:hypothetical protein